MRMYVCRYIEYGGAEDMTQGSLLTLDLFLQ
jgi:hypothetical protein